MTQIVNGLAVTPRRRAFVRAIAETGRIYHEHAANACFDLRDGVKVTDRVRELLAVDWIRAATADERRHGESATRTYYRLTAFGEAVLKGER